MPRPAGPAPSRPDAFLNIVKGPIHPFRHTLAYVA
jgi:hypothetical protein